MLSLDSGLLEVSLDVGSSDETSPDDEPLDVGLPDDVLPDDVAFEEVGTPPIPASVIWVGAEPADSIFPLCCLHSGR